LSKQTRHFIQKEIKVIFLGDLTPFPADFISAANECMDKTKNLTRMTLCLCVNYGGRADIMRAVNKIIADGETNMTEQDFSRYLYTADIPDPDLVVRTSGECRVSNFMLWQMAYSELKFIDIYWPDITDEIIDEIVAEYRKRDRRRGK
jgi:undecaprenyl diphosphate synthase